VKLGIDSYSLRSQGWDPFRLLEYAAEVGLDGVQFSEAPRELASFEPDYLGELRARAEGLGLYLEVGMGSFCRYASNFEAARGSGEAQLAAMIEVAVAVGSPVVRCFLGASPDREGPIPLRQKIDEAVRTLRAVRQRALAAGVKIGVENHSGDLQARELLGLILAAGTEFVGACLDTGNPLWAAEDPHLAVEMLAPYAVTTQVRDGRAWLTPSGAEAVWTPMGEGALDLEVICRRLAEQAPAVRLNLEIITGTGSRALDFYEPDFWTRFPTTSAADFARFIRLAVRGAPYEREMAVVRRGEQVSEETSRAFARQQLDDFERSVRYCREQLRLGERG
jgi:3-oxoisoapionate decarboxylase